MHNQTEVIVDNPLPKVLRMGDPDLYKVSTAFVLPNELGLASEIFKIMQLTVQSIGAALGIAAPQIGIFRRIVMFDVPAKHPRYRTDGIAVPLCVLINPSYRPLSEEQNLEWEACLSVPGMMGQVPRYTHIEYQYTDLEGTHHVCQVSNFHARVVQHEIDHLDGILYPLRIKDKKNFGFLDEIMASTMFLASRA